MNYCKKFSLYFFTTTLLSCNPKNDNGKNSAQANNEKKENKTTIQPNTEVVQEENQDSVVRAIKTIVKKQEEARQRNWQSVFPKGTWKTYPQIVSSIFGRGSTKEEVRSIMGSPELIEQFYGDDAYRNEKIKETWYYGDIEIRFKFSIVIGGENLEKCDKYVSTTSLLMSSDPYESKLGELMVGRLAYRD